VFSLRSDEGVHAHIRVKATNIKKMTVFCFTGAKVRKKVKSEE
jgi:hypothetical protein